MNLFSVNQRIAELWTIKKAKPLTRSEEIELDLCLQAITNYMWKLNELENLSFLAYEINDMDWQHELCASIDKLKEKATAIFDDGDE
jgi:hypothetical protein